MHTPIATYRIQFNPSFTFRDAKEILPYLADLGISDIYASPVFKAREGSTHGYDIVDPSCVNPELGTDEDFEDLLSEARRLGMRWMQDIVPNHMAFDFDNTILMDVLENGKLSPYYNYFDIDWDHPYENMSGRVLAPFLGSFYAECLEKGEIILEYEKGSFHIRYFERRLPVKIESYWSVIEYAVADLEKRFGKDSPDLIKLLGAAHLLSVVTSEKKKTGSLEQVRHAKHMVRELYEANEPIRQAIECALRYYNGEQGKPESFDALDKLISEQLFRLSFWKVAAEEINYRRFFNINELISLRIEDEAVFNFAHEFVLSQIERGRFHGLRIDHIDGLDDPTAYLRRLREKAPNAYIVVEKILETDEKLPSRWPVQGTTGYDFMNRVNGVLCDKGNANTMSRVYNKFSGTSVSYEDLVSDKKRLIIGKHMAGNIDNLAQHIKRISTKDRYGRDITLYGLRRALVEVIAYFPIYRTYVDETGYGPVDREYIKSAIQKSRSRAPALLHEISFIEKFLLLKYDESIADEDKREWIHFAMSFQQQTGPLMAKGFEDTVLYIYNRLISLNEVGSAPERFGYSIDEFHGFNTERSSLCPLTLNATATHDTKRGEDTRACINVLSEMSDEWGSCLKEWSKINRKEKKRFGDLHCPDNNDEYFLYQTLIGALPFTGVDEGFAGRIKEYMIKAVREAKRHTGWIKPDTEYEESSLSFIDGLLDTSGENEFLGSFLPFQKKVAYFGMYNSLTQVLLKIVCPGVPDIYQGRELWDFSLVDPDNRRPVNYQKLQIGLQSIIEREKMERTALIEELLRSKEDGRIKLFLTYRALQARKRYRELFQEGEYIPLSAEGAKKDCVISFMKKHNGAICVVIAPRFFTRLVEPGKEPLAEDVWKDTCVLLPEGAPSKWNDEITGLSIESGRRMMVGLSLSSFPGSILIGA
ncbi:malto-oligosyltrehalose synthase [Candidatus Omnitrophota bacterium]